MENSKYKHRMSTQKIIMKNPDGSVIKNKEVTVSQKNHKFLFGCGEFSFIPLSNNECNKDESEKLEQRAQKFFELFNFTTLPFYWEGFENVKGNPDTQRLINTAKWLTSKGCIVKGHPLCWHTLTAPWLLDMTNSQILSAQLDRIKREVKDFAGLIDMWDVINEAVIMPVFQKYDNGITRICKELGRIGTIREMFAAAKNTNPDAKLLINDFVYTSIDSYEILIEACLEAGIPIDAIGIQSHMHQGYWGVEKTQEILERFSQFNLPIHFTESTLVSGHLMPADIIDFNDYVVDNWPSTPEGEERQAREIGLHYKTLFSHPSVESVTSWEFTDGQWLSAPSGFITQENRLKPAYEELRKLIKGEWWTKSETKVTDEDGAITVSGFLGEYEAVCCDKKVSFTLDNKSEDIVLNL